VSSVFIRGDINVVPHILEEKCLVERLRYSLGRHPQRSCKGLFAWSSVRRKAVQAENPGRIPMFTRVKLEALWPHATEAKTVITFPYLLGCMHFLILT
jgi:hypothetical protein